MNGFLSPADYVVVYEKVPRICVSVVMTGPRGVALVKRVEEPEKGHWHLPGGRIFKHETVDVAAKRVVKRELGVDFVVDGLLGYIENLGEQYYTPAGSVTIHNIDIVLHAVTEETEFRPEKYDEGQPAWFNAVPPDDEWNVKHIQFLVERGFLGGT